MEDAGKMFSGLRHHEMAERAPLRVKGLLQSDPRYTSFISGDLILLDEDIRWSPCRPVRAHRPRSFLSHSNRPAANELLHELHNRVALGVCGFEKRAAAQFS